MITLTKEWLLKTIAELEEERDAVPGVVNEDAAKALEAMKIALVSLEADSKLSDFVASQESLGGEFEGVLTENIESLYVTSNHAVKITSRDLDEGFDKWYTGDACGTNSIAPEWFSEALKPVFLETWRACRAAMLQGAESVTTAYKLPANTPCKDAPEHIWLQTSGIWTENAEFSELTWCSDNQHPDDTLYVRADVVSGNSPVIPDGWVLVPIEPTYQMCEAMGLQWESPRFPDRYKAMLAAVKNSRNFC